MHAQDRLPTDVEKIRSLNSQEYEAAIDSMSNLIELLQRLDMSYDSWKVKEIRDYIVERRMNL